MSKTASSKNVSKVDIKSYIERGHERAMAIKRSEEAARKVYELSLVEEYEPLKGYEDTYQISRNYPHHIRKIKGKHVVKERQRKDGYIQLDLNNGIKRSTPLKHRLIAIQWIDNDDPDNKKFVDHRNQHRDDNRIENLIRSTQSANESNKSSYKGIDCEYIDLEDLSDKAIDVLDYGEHEFEYYIYDPATDDFYYYNGDKCRTLHVIKDTKSGALFVNMPDINNNKVAVYYNKFKKLYGFI